MFLSITEDMAPPDLNFLYLGFFQAPQILSKALRGLFVLQYGRSIFTTISISWRVLLRQWGFRDALHTGQQLIDY